MYAINVGNGFNNRIGCKTAVVDRSSPYGSLDTVSGGFGEVRLTGWAIDPDTDAPIPVHVYVDDVGRANVPADRPRGDVGALFATSPHKGYDITVKGLAPGRHTVCAYGINVAGYGTNTTLGCQQVEVYGGDPIGGIFSFAV